MHKIDSANATISGEFRDGQAASGTPGTTVSAAWLNSVQRELIAILEFVNITPDKNNDAQIIEAIKLIGVPVGTMIKWAGNVFFPPAGYLLANGQLVSRIDYARLFAIIGTTYGVGDGSTTFALPNDMGFIIKF